MSNNTNVTEMHMDIDDFLIFGIFLMYILEITILIPLWLLFNNIVKCIKDKFLMKKN